MSPYIEIKAEGRNATWIPVAILLSQELWTLGKKCKNCVKLITLKIALMYWLLSFCLSIGLQKNLKKTWMLVLRGSKARQCWEDSTLPGILAQGGQNGKSESWLLSELSTAAEGRGGRKELAHVISSSPGPRTHSLQQPLIPACVFILSPSFLHLRGSHSLPVPVKA